MAFFRNTTVNLLNLHSGIHALVTSGAGAFFGVFLLRAGVSAPLVLAAVAAIFIGRFAIRPIIPALASRWGLKPLVLLGTIACAGQYPILALVHGPDVWLLGVVLTASIGDTLYWTSYHAYFAALGDEEHRGHQIGAREAIAAVVGIVGPLLTGWALTVYGPGVAFGAAGITQILSALPLLATPNIKVARSAPGAFRASIPGMLMFTADGWIAAGYVICWQISLFLTLNQNFSAYGGAMALAAVAGAVSGLMLGRLIDAGHGERAVWLAASVYIATIGLRAASQGHPVLALIANACGAFVACLYTPTIMTAVYNQAKQAPCTLRFHVAAEGGFDVGAGAGCLVTAGLLALGAPLSAGILLSMLGVAAAFILLSRYYRGALAA